MRRALLTLLLLDTLALSGCAAFSDTASAPSPDGRRLRVVASFYPLQYAAQRVAGKRAEVTDLTRPGAEPHDLEIPPRQTAEVVDADLVVYESGFQPAVDDVVQQDGVGSTLDVTGVAHLVAPDHGGHDHGAQDHGSAEEASSDLDPHFWQDPERMAAVGDAVAAELSRLDPDHTATYRRNAASLRRDLDALDADYRRILGSCERDTVVVSHDAFGYLAKYGLAMEPIAGLSPGAEPTPADLARLEDLIRREGITTVFSERLVSPRLSASLAEDVGVRTAVLDPIEGLSDETAGQDYLSLMRANLRALTTANGCS